MAVTAVTTYTVTARRWGNYWELHINGGKAGVTQSRTLAKAEEMVRDYLALDDRPDAATATVDIRPELDGNLAAEAEAAREAVRTAEQMQRDAATRQRTIARRLKASGLSGADIAAVLRVSTQRVSQLVNS